MLLRKIPRNSSGFLLSLEKSIYFSSCSSLFIINYPFTVLSSLSIRGFRGYSEASFALSHETAIIGASGSGKTHILEAVHIASG